MLEPNLTDIVDASTDLISWDPTVNAWQFVGGLLMLDVATAKKWSELNLELGRHWKYSLA